VLGTHQSTQKQNKARKKKRNKPVTSLDVLFLAMISNREVLPDPFLKKEEEEEKEVEVEFEKDEDLLLLKNKGATEPELPKIAQHCPGMTTPLAPKRISFLSLLKRPVGTFTE